MELSALQNQILNSPSKKTVVLSSAASGKSRLLTEKVRQILRAGVNPRDIAAITFTNMAAGELKSRLGEDYKEGLYVGTIHGLANYMLCRGGVDTSKVLKDEDFDRLFHLIKMNPNVVIHLKWILLDEAQDSDSNQFEFMFKMINPECFFVCGDPKQCQPAGTKILLRGGKEKNIEDILPGDEIVWYDNTNGRCCGLNNSYNAVHKYVQNIESHDISTGIITTVTTEDGLTSKYTENHRTFIKMRDDTQYEHCIYLMCDNTYRFRVGKIALRGTKTKNGNPWRTKMTDEKCTKIWLLKVFENDLDARVYEQKISYKYQIPQICWQTDKVKWTQEHIDYIYDGLDTKTGAKQCLIDHNLSIDYPLIDKNIEWSMSQKFASNAVAQLYAINIIPEVMDCIIYNSNAKNYKEFKHITCTKDVITKPTTVYSLNVDGETYVADGIITHNSIYQWKGSDPSLLINLANRSDVELFHMNENFRNGTNILNYAKKIITPTGLDDLSMSKTGKSGVVTKATFNADLIVDKICEEDEFKNWAILTRTNQEIDVLSQVLIRADIPFDTFKQGDLSKEELNTKMEQNTVKLLTIHSAKGLEWNNVIVIGARYYNNEERNTGYVAATRARNQLIWMSGPTKAFINSLYR